MWNLDLFFKEVEMFQREVAAYTGKNRDINLGDSFVRADTEQQAMELGKSALRITGVRGAYRVEAVPYHPWADWAFTGFVRKVGE